MQPKSQRIAVLMLVVFVVSCNPRFCTAPSHSHSESRDAAASPAESAGDASDVDSDVSGNDASSSDTPVAAAGTPGDMPNIKSTPMIVVDQIGYRTDAEKWFMVKNPQQGYDAGESYVPGSYVTLVSTADNKSIKEIPLVAWQQGKTDSVFSGDRVWQGNFTDVTTPGSYYILDATNNRRSHVFEIGDSVYRKVLSASVKSFFYQRSNTAIAAASGKQWTHRLDHEQQKSAHLFDNAKGGDQGDGTSRDISGGWFDAGDYRKYTAWMAPIIWDLAYAQEWYPAGFTDNTEIPESGNGVPDIIDEIKVELDWMLKMQRDDGALFSGCFVTKRYAPKTGSGKGDPAKDDQPYFYANISTSATASGVASFAIGARIFEQYKTVYPGYAKKLRKAAINGWRFLKDHRENIKYEHTGFDNADANKDEAHDGSLRMLAAAALFRLTLNKEYQRYVDDNYHSPDLAENGHQPISRNMFDTSLSQVLQRGLVTYGLTEGATEDVVAAIRTAVKNGIEWVIVSKKNECPYRSFMYEGHYNWGSNSIKAAWGNLLLVGVALDVNPVMSDLYRELAEEYLHYFHGRNATSYCYLTQCQLMGGDNSITRIYHSWFHDGTAFGANPAPGFLSGGPNRSFSPQVAQKIVPPQDQPPMKAYKDWNSSWPQNSWEITENSTAYQSRYVLLAAAFAQR